MSSSDDPAEWFDTWLLDNPDASPVVAKAALAATLNRMINQAEGRGDHREAAERRAQLVHALHERIN